MKKFAQKVLKFDSVLARIESAVLITSLGSMIFIAFLQVILRNWFDTSINWGDNLARHLVLWVAFLGAGLATRENRHINIDAISRVLTPAWRRRAYVLTNLFSASISALLVQAAFTFVRDEQVAGTILFAGIPVWIFMSIIFIGFVIITYRFLIRAFLPSLADQITTEGD